MTKKRFEVFDDNGYLFIKDNQGKFKPHELCNVYQYCKYINQLSEENEQLKSDKNDLITVLFKRSDEKQKLQSEIQDFQELLTQKDNVCYEQVIKLIDEKIEIADTYRTPIKSLKYGDDLGYWNGVYQSMKELKKELKDGDVE